jgi:hypothetical protein
MTTFAPMSPPSPAARDCGGARARVLHPPVGAAVCKGVS